MATQAPVFQPEPLGEATYPYQTTASASVNMRKKPSASAARMLTIPADATITVLETSGDFLKVTYREYTGYAMSDYIHVPEQYLSGKSLPIDLNARQNYEVLSVNASGDKVRALQQALTELGYYKGTADGSYGAGTLAAVKAFQDKNKLRATGVALPELQQLIYEKRPRNAAGRLVSLTPAPIPGYPMQQGDMGDAVAIVQPHAAAAGASGERLYQRIHRQNSDCGARLPEGAQHPPDRQGGQFHAAGHQHRRRHHAPADTPACRPAAACNADRQLCAAAKGAQGVAVTNCRPAWWRRVLSDNARWRLRG